MIIQPREDPKFACTSVFGERSVKGNSVCTGDPDSFLLMQQSDQAQSEDAAAKPLIWDSGPIHRDGPESTPDG